MLKEWLNIMIPDSVSMEDFARLSISLTPVGKSPYLVSGFKDKEDVIKGMICTVLNYSVFIGCNVCSLYCILSRSNIYGWEGFNRIPWRKSY